MATVLALRSVATTAVVLVLQVASAHALEPRTWVSGTGSDAAACTRTAPCKTIAGALLKTAARGEISILDPVETLGPVVIQKSISIVAEGSEGGITGAGQQAGILINAGAGDVISLHNLFIEGGGTGVNGIRLVKAGSLHIRNCLIRGFRAAGGAGISVEPTGGNRLLISNTTVSNNASGISVIAAGANYSIATLDDVIVEQSATSGIRADGANVSIRINDVTVTNNTTGLSALNGGQIISFGNNALIGNGVNGAPTLTVPLQ